MTISGEALEEHFREDAQLLVGRSNQYWIQAVEQLEGQHLEKASELAWGSVLERVKALALVRSKVALRSHRDVRNYVKAEAARVGDQELFRTFQRAESLHINFYESFFELDEITEGFQYVREVLPRIDAYMFESGP